MLDHLDDPRPFTPGPGFREGVDRRRRALRRRHRLVGLAATVAVLTGLTGAALAYAQRRDAAIDRIDVATSPSVDGSVNVLVVGSDRGLDGQGPRSDVLIVARFDAEGSVRLLSIPRDLVDERSGQRVNQAYEEGVQRWSTP